MEDTAGRRARGRLVPGDVGRMAVTWACGALSLWATAGLLPGLSGSGPWVWWLAALVTGVVGGLLRPALVLLAAAVGWLGVLAVALAGQAVVMHVALQVVPGVEVSSWGTALAAAWVAAAVATVIGWLLTAGTPDSLVASLVRTPAGAGGPPDDGVTGVLFVQLDGVPAPLLTWALQAGLMPTLRRWVDAGTHVVREWQVQMPCTTPASQLGILHGSCEGVPAFRWYDRELGRLLVANRGADARIIEDRVSDGRGLLADDGASVSNLFSGDAERSFMVFSRVGVTRGRFETRRALAHFLARPDGLSRSMSRAVAEVGRERFQARRQRRRGVVPRVHRPWPFTGLRAATNGLLRDLNLALVAGELMAGRRSVYVDFVDYDEVAHHAGPMRLESLHVLTELDLVVSILEEVVRAAPRPYEVVLLSDHGQSLGAPFAERHGEDLATVCRRLMGGHVAWAGDTVEDWGRMGGLAHDVAAGGGVTERAAGSVARRIDGRLGGPEGAPEEPVVLGSGNLGLLYAGGPRRLTLEQLEARWPGLVGGLATHPGVSFVAGLDEAGHPVAVGAAGRRDLATGEITGEDPLTGLPAHAADVLAPAVRLGAAPDLYVNSALDPGTDEVAAFEDLVGSHGGLGGWQDRGMLMAPAHLLDAVGDEPVVGAVGMHRLLVGMLEHLGHRASLREPAT